MITLPAYNAGLLITPENGAASMSDQRPVIGIIMGSQSDWETMKNAADVL